MCVHEKFWNYKCNFFNRYMAIPMVYSTCFRKLCFSKNLYVSSTLSNLLKLFAVLPYSSFNVSGIYGDILVLFLMSVIQEWRVESTDLISRNQGLGINKSYSKTFQFSPELILELNLQSRRPLWRTEEKIIGRADTGGRGNA